MREAVLQKQEQDRNLPHIMSIQEKTLKSLKHLLILKYFFSLILDS